MPTYVYRCASGHTKEHTLSIQYLDSHEIYCLVCATEYVFGNGPLDAIRMHRVPLAPAVHFKGSGFYSTGG